MNSRVGPARKSLCASAQVVSDGLACFQAVTAAGATYNSTIAGGGAASVKLPQFRAVNTFLGNLKTAFAGAYHSFDFAQYAVVGVNYLGTRRIDSSELLPVLTCCLT